MFECAERNERFRAQRGDRGSHAATLGPISCGHLQLNEALEVVVVMCVESSTRDPKKLQRVA